MKRDPSTARRLAQRLADLAVATVVVLLAVAVLRPFEPEAAADPLVHPAMWSVLATPAPDVETRPATPPELPLERPAAAAGPLTPAMIEACLAVAEDLDARLAEQLRELRARDRSAFARGLEKSRRLIAMAELRERDPAVYDRKLTAMRVDAKVSRLAAEVRAARAAGSAQAAALEDELRGQVILQLGFRHLAREEYLRSLCEAVERMERELRYEKEHFGEVLASRMGELLDE